LTYTKAGGRTKDSAQKGIIDYVKAEFFNKDGYGWKNCVGLKMPNNADSKVQSILLVDFPK